MTERFEQNNEIPDIHAAPDRWYPRLLGLLDQQIERSCSLLELSRTQADCIRGEQTDALLRTLAQRQAILDQITATNREIEPFRRVWDQLIPRLDEPERSELRMRVDQIDEIASEIMKGDERDRALLEERRTVIAGQVAEVRNSRGAVAAYSRAGAPSRAHFQDREG